MENEVLEYLAGGMGKEDTLRITGCSEEQFIAILQTEGFNARLRARAIELTEDRIVQRETRVLDKMLQQMEYKADEFDASGLSKVYETIHRQRLLKQQAGNAGHFANPTVGRDIVLVMPVNMQQERVLTNDRNEVVAIGDRNMGALPLEGVKKLFDKLRNEQQQDIFTVNPQHETQPGDVHETASVA